MKKTAILITIILCSVIALGCIGTDTNTKTDGSADDSATPESA